MTIENDRGFQPLESLDDLMSQDVLLERYPWLSTAILGRWRTSGAVRALRGKDQQFVYHQADLVSAVNSELVFWSETAKSRNSTSHGICTAPGDDDDMTEQERLNTEHSLRVIFGDNRSDE